MENILMKELTFKEKYDALGQNAGTFEGIFITAVKTTGIDLDENPEQIMACVVGFDLNHEIGKKVFKEWLYLSQDGKSFQNNPGSHPGFMTHRHDQSVLSAILHKYKVKLLPYGHLIYEAHEKDGFEGRTAYFLNKGIK